MVFFCVSKPCRDFQGRDGMSREGVERAQIPISHWLQPHHQPITACCAKGTYAIHLGYHCALPLWAPSPEASTLLVLLLFFFNFNSSCDTASTVNRSVLRLSLRPVRRQTCLSTRSFSVEGLVAKGSLFSPPSTSNY